ncbi:MAG: phage major capsid protein, partial [Elusimicrobiota bacterium]
MSYLSNRTILEKADLALADLTAGGGILKPAQAQKFMRLLIKDSVLLKMATVVPMASPKQQISKIKFGSRILRPGQEATALAAGDRAKPD